MEIQTFEAIDVPEISELNYNTNFLIETKYLNSNGLTTTSPRKINLGDLLTNIFSNTLDSLINPIFPTKSSEQINNNLKEHKIIEKKLHNLTKKLHDLDSQIQQILNKIG
jgi:hypothetical protein